MLAFWACGAEAAALFGVRLATPEHWVPLGCAGLGLVSRLTAGLAAEAHPAAAVEVGYPGAGRVELVALPRAYTDLHADLSERLSCSVASLAAGGSADEPQACVCLLCGACLNSHGKGRATAHAAQCGHGVGLFFLLHVNKE
jgi:hypothetical protein